MKAKLVGMLGGLLTLLPAAAFAEPASDKTCRSFPLVGVGLVSGLAGTGDDAEKIPFTALSLASYLKSLGVEDFRPPKTRKVALVMATATVHFCKHQGEVFQLDGDKPLGIAVARMGDASSLDQGVLLPTGLHGPDNKVYLVGSGPVAPCPATLDAGRGDPKVAPMCVLHVDVPPPPSAPR